MYISKKDIARLRECAEEIQRIASMETCAFKDMEVIDVQRVRGWAQWFTCYARRITDVLEYVAPTVTDK